MRDGDFHGEIGVGYIKRLLAFIYKDEGEIFKAIHLMEESVDIAEKDAKRRVSLEAKRNYAASVENYALLLFDTMRERAVEKYAQALELYSEIAEESVNKSDAKDVLRLSAWLGAEYERQGDVERAVKEYERANSARNENDGSYYELEADEERAKRCVSLGKLYLKLGEAERAVAILQEAIEQLEGVSECEEVLCDAQVAYGDACAALGEKKTAVEWYDVAIRDYLFVCMRTQNTDYYCSVATVYRRKAELYTGLKRRKWLKRAYKIAKMLATKFPNMTAYTELFRELSVELGKK